MTFRLLLGLILPVLLHNLCVARDTDQQCGGQSLHSLLVHTGVPVQLSDILEKLPGNGQNSSLQELAELATNDYAQSCIAIRWSTFPAPGTAAAIIPVSGRDSRLHFVAILEWEAEAAIVEEKGRIARVSAETLRRGGWMVRRCTCRQMLTP